MRSPAFCGRQRRHIQVPSPGRNTCGEQQAAARLYGRYERGECVDCKVVDVVRLRGVPDQGCLVRPDHARVHVSARQRSRQLGAQGDCVPERGHLLRPRRRRRSTSATSWRAASRSSRRCCSPAKSAGSSTPTTTRAPLLGACLASFEKESHTGPTSCNGGLSGLGEQGDARVPKLIGVDMNLVVSLEQFALQPEYNDL